jgi:hypothetical protein
MQKGLSGGERCRYQHFLLKLPMSVRWTGESGMQEVRTESANVSSRGICFRLPVGLESTSKLEIDLSLQASPEDENPIDVLSFGRILHTRGTLGAAAEIERYEFVRNRRAA